MDDTYFSIKFSTGTNINFSTSVSISTKTSLSTNEQYQVYLIINLILINNLNIIKYVIA
jgi:hypothetical protein